MAFDKDTIELRKYAVSQALQHCRSIDDVIPMAEKVFKFLMKEKHNALQDMFCAKKRPIIEDSVGGPAGPVIWTESPRSGGLK